MGYSGDADPDPYWLAMMLEVDGYGTAASQSILPFTSFGKLGADCNPMRG
jgi:hypothetical protein